MTLSDYLILATIAEFNSLTITAEKLHLTKSAISHALARMEKETELPLFDRTNKSVSLSRYGKELLPYVNTILKDQDRLHEKIDTFKGLESGSVRIGTFSSVCTNWIPDIVKSFRLQYPDIDIKVRSGASNSVIIDWLNANEIDIGIGSGGPYPGIDVAGVYQDEMLMVTDPHFQPKEGNTVTAADLDNIPFIIQEAPFNEDILPVFNELHLKPQKFISSFDDLTLISMVESGMGSAILAKLVLKRLSIAVNVFSFQPKQYRTLGILTKHGVQQTKAVRKMRHFIQNYADQFPTDYELDLLFVPD